jgi:crossover junction endodeoxyribonuclease RuvC
LSTRILGIDPGSRNAGYGVIEIEGSRVLPLDHGVIRVPASEALGTRLQKLHAALIEVIERHRPHEVAIEEVFTAHNIRSALVLGQARGVLLLAASSGGCEVHEYAARAVKKAIAGYGQADKTQVGQMVKSLLGLSKVPAQDAADALAIALCHAHSREMKRRAASQGGDRMKGSHGSGRKAWARVVEARERKTR